MRSRFLIFIVGNRKQVFLLSAVGQPYPAIKNGYALFAIAPTDIPSKLVFAGWRFFGAGLLLLAVAVAGGKRISGFGGRAMGQFALLGLTQTTLQYLFFDAGLADTTGVKSSFMNASWTFLSVLMAHFIYLNDRLSGRKLFGCAIGFIGVMVFTLGRGPVGSRQIDFTLLGAGFVVIAAL